MAHVVPIARFSPSVLPSQSPQCVYAQSTCLSGTRGPSLGCLIAGHYGQGLGYRRGSAFLPRTRKASHAPARLRAGAAWASLVQKVTAKELDDILSQERKQPLVVDFYAVWCGPCLLLGQVLDRLAAEYGDAVRFLKLDTDAEPEFAEEMEIRGLPTMVFVSTEAEKQAIRTEGLLPEKVIREILEKELKIPSPVAST